MMTGEEKRARINEWLEQQEEEALFADGFDEAIVGVGRQFTKPLFVVYNWNKCIEILMEGGELCYVEAVEHMDFNVTGSWVGVHTPVFIQLPEELNL